MTKFSEHCTSVMETGKGMGSQKLQKRIKNALLEVVPPRSVSFLSSHTSLVSTEAMSEGARSESADWLRTDNRTASVVHNVAERGRATERGMSSSEIGRKPVLCCEYNKPPIFKSPQHKKVPMHEWSREMAPSLHMHLDSIRMMRCDVCHFFTCI